jgi:hypothetical protein
VPLMILVFSLGKHQLRQKIDGGIRENSKNVNVMGMKDIFHWEVCKVLYICVTLYKDNTKSHFHELITRERCFRFREVSSMCWVSKFSVFNIFIEDVDMWRSCARWLPIILSDYGNLFLVFIWRLYHSFTFFGFPTLSTWASLTRLD